MARANMGTKKSAPGRFSKKSSARRDAGGTATSARSTVSGPARGGQDRRYRDALVQKLEGTQATAAAIPFNANKPAEHGAGALKPPAGSTAKPPSSSVTGSTLTEAVRSAKVGEGKPNLGLNPGNLPLDRVRTDATDRVLTTNQGVPVSDN